MVHCFRTGYRAFRWPMNNMKVHIHTVMNTNSYHTLTLDRGHAPERLSQHYGPSDFMGFLTSVLESTESSLLQRYGIKHGIWRFSSAGPE